MEVKVVIEIIKSLQEKINISDRKSQKLFYKQKKFMEEYPNYPSLKRKKLTNVKDKYGNYLYTIRLDIKRRIVFVKKKNNKIIWLAICTHDELRKNTITVPDDY